MKPRDSYKFIFYFLILNLIVFLLQGQCTIKKGQLRLIESHHKVIMKIIEWERR